MDKKSLTKLVTYTLPVLVGLGMLATGIAGCNEHIAGSDFVTPNNFGRWGEEAQVEYVREQNVERRKAMAAPKSDVAQPIIFGPLIAVGLGLVGCMAVFVCAQECN